MILEILKMSIQSLFASKLRSFLSMLGIVIGVAAVISIVSIASGTKVRITEQISSLGSDVITVIPGVKIGKGGKISRNFSDLFPIELGGYIKEFCPSVKEVLPELQVSGLLITEEANIRSTLIGTEPPYRKLFDYHVLKGQFISKEDIDGARSVIVLGYDLAEDLFGNKNPLGKKVRINFNKHSFLFTVIGVMDEKEKAFGVNFNERAYIPITTIMKKMTKTRYVTSFSVQSKKKTNTQATVDEVNYFLTQYFRDPDKFNIFSPEQILGVINNVTNTLGIMLGGIAAISLIVGGIGIMNIMLVSVTERTREIGIRKALGAKKGDIMFQFLIEAFTLSGGGGLVGVILGYFGAGLVAKMGNWPPVVTPLSVVIAFGFSLIIGLFFGIYPAFKAANLNPIDALSYE